MAHPISVDGRKRSKTLQNENDVRKYHRRVCLQHAHRVQHTSQRGLLFSNVSVRTVENAPKR